MDSQGILNDQEQETKFSEWQQNGFKYSNLGPTAWVHKIYFGVREHKQWVLISLIFLLILIGYIIDIAQNSRLGDLEDGGGSHSHVFDYYDYNEIDADFMVNIDVLGKYAHECHPFFCPGGENKFCYCLSEVFSNFETANRACTNALSGELVQFRDTDEEQEFLNKMWRFSTIRKRILWVGMTQKKGEEPKWMNCTDCEKMTELDSHLKKGENLTRGDHSCLMMTDGLLQRYPCSSPRLSPYETKYVYGEKTPYWFDQEVVAQVYGLHALCECTLQDQAEKIESDTYPFQAGRYVYALSKYKYLEQSRAAELCRNVSGCWLASICDSNEQKWISNFGMWSSLSPLVWIGGKTIGTESNSNYKWEEPGCGNNVELDFGPQMDKDTQCFALGNRIAGARWDHILHARDCDDYQSFACQIPTHRLKAAKAATNKQISLRLIQHLGKTCKMFDCISNTKCYCVLSAASWKEALYQCGLELMDLVIVTNTDELDFLTKNTKMELSGYVAGHDFHNEKKLTWVNEMGGNEAPVKVNDNKVITNWTETTGGCLYLKRGKNPFVLQNCEMAGKAVCEFDVMEFSDKWEEKQKDYEED